jgi:hypothetical protein
MVLTGFKPIKSLTLSKRWFVSMVLLVGLVCAVFFREANQLSQQIESANRQTAESNVRVAILEAWVRAQMSFPQAGLTADEAQAFNQTFPPKPDSALLNAGIESNKQ